MSRAYLAVLAAVAVLILAVGLVVRRTIARHDRPTRVAPPSEAAALQQLSQEGELRRTGDFVARRVATVAARVEWVPATHAAGVRWHGDTLVSSTPERPLVVLQVPRADSAPVPGEGTSDSTPGWVLAVGRLEDGQVVSAVGLAGGRARHRCGTQDVEEIVVGVPLHDRLVGAGLFGLDGSLVGVVVRCPERVVAITADAVARLVATAGASRAGAGGALGLSADTLDARARAYFASDSGLLVTEIRRDGPAAAAGLRPGDVLLAIDGTSATGRAGLERLDRAAAADSVVLTRRRGTSTATLRIVRRAPGADSSTLGIVVTAPPAPSGVAVTAIDPTSPAGAAGLRPGDRLLRVGRADVRSVADARRLLADAGASPTFIVFARDSIERGVLVAR